ncbi:MAG TPA: type IV pili methyl-accepting chemotaxis transducer N-terminal domain-containing protein [Aromatoleum sp.]|uniref:type IV pili methyl-accepting chemotaxis transducer N-terminal domain-containing protein n=1 Tax=Aromatoleum sp. TaxID=2307007 RepID=UPI002B490514|nr:type IV pili methyl-accepting chemotaxis transducer N-terminal domain-containing protein [Aromatoleum sp.]HJV27565.1 type IV pili methyl-accepting chemotaxis transducer N-terminal domain-containing protein [Aromatoleum sp.]
MLRPRNSLATKITGILLVFFLVALTAIGITLFMSWQLEGAAAAINDAGSLRMRAYRIANLLARADATSLGEPEEFSAALRGELDQFDDVLDELRRGDPKRPLFIPRDNDIPADLDRMTDSWSGRVRPLLRELITDPDPSRLHGELAAFDRTTTEFVGGMNAVVLKMEQSYARNTDILRASQVSLIALAVIGTLVLIRFFFVLVIRPVSELRDGMKRMEEEDFSARVPVLATDEFGELSDGFNRMAVHLQGLYETLEERVAAKTRSLEEKNRELEILYDIGAFLREPNDVDSLCRGFLQRVQTTLGASASSARLLDPGSQNLCLTVHDGLDQKFVAREAVLECGECICGEAARRGSSLVCEMREPAPLLTLSACRKAGFEVVSATTITANKQTLGLYNLFFRDPRPFTDSDRLLLETLGQQLGIAIENQRLQASGRELAVSEERNLLARELHDSIAQGLAFMNLQVQMLDDALKRNDEGAARDTLAMLRQGVQESYDDVRELLVHFRTRVAQQDLAAAITATLRRLAEQTGIATDLELAGDAAPLDPEAETQVLYIVQEALSNVRKHASARSVKVSMQRGVEGLAVIVRDDGVGFDLADRSATAQDSHIGLQIMRERALRIGGRFAVRSSSGEGTEVRLELPRTNREIQ